MTIPMPNGHHSIGITCSSTSSESLKAIALKSKLSKTLIFFSESLLVSGTGPTLKAEVPGEPFPCNLTMASIRAVATHVPLFSTVKTLSSSSVLTTQPAPFLIAEASTGYGICYHDHDDGCYLAVLRHVSVSLSKWESLLERVELLPFVVHLENLGSVTCHDFCHRI